MANIQVGHDHVKYIFLLNFSKALIVLVTYTLESALLIRTNAQREKMNLVFLTS